MPAFLVSFSRALYRALLSPCNEATGFLHQPPLLSLQVEDFYQYVHVHAVERVVDLGTKLIDVLPVLDTHEYL